MVLIIQFLFYHNYTNVSFYNLAQNVSTTLLINYHSKVWDGKIFNVFE